VTREQVVGLSGRHHLGDDEAGVTRDAHPDRRTADVAVAEWDLRRREPEVPLGELAGT
jgi:hypothetical protein